MTEVITITKIDAAQRQLETALTLWFANGDEVSIHALATNAYQLIHDLNCKRQYREDLLFDTILIKDEYRKDFVAFMKKASNFFKHADRGKAANIQSIELKPVLSELFLIMSIRGLSLLGVHPVGLRKAFMLWVSFNRPNWCKEGALKAFIDSIPIEVRNGMISNRHGFLQACLQSEQSSPATTNS